MFNEHAKNCRTDVAGEGLLFNVTSERYHREERRARQECFQKSL